MAADNERAPIDRTDQQWLACLDRALQFWELLDRPMTETDVIQTADRFCDQLPTNRPDP